MCICRVPGENCHRGAALGALLAANAANKVNGVPADLKDNLNSLRDGIKEALSEMNSDL